MEFVEFISKSSRFGQDETVDFAELISNCQSEVSYVTLRDRKKVSLAVSCPPNPSTEEKCLARGQSLTRGKCK